MPNVKPGDIAKVIYDPDSCGGRSNVGKHCFVLGPPPFRAKLGSYIRQISRSYGLLWECKPLEGFWGWGQDAGPDRRIFCSPEPNMFFVIPDSFLRRIDPPAEDEDIFQTEPLAHERKEKQDA